MAVLNDQQKEEMRAASRSTAFALSDDLKHIREIISKDQPSQGDIRRLSTLLRRILLDGDMRTVAAPRMGRIMLSAPQLKPYHHANERMPIHLFVGGTFEFNAASMANMHFGQMPLKMQQPAPDEVVPLNIEQFLAQRVLCYEGRWLSRAAIIKYIVIAAHAAHSADPKKDPDYELLHEVRHRAAVRLTNGFPSVEFITDFGDTATDKLRFDRDRIDLALLLLHSTAKYLINSADVRKLEEMIDTEHDTF